MLIIELSGSIILLLEIIAIFLQPVNKVVGRGVLEDDIHYPSF